MIVDSSAVVAVLNQEDGWRDFDTALREANHPQMSAATYVELGIVVDRLGDPSVSRRLDRLLDSWGRGRAAHSSSSAYRSRSPSRLRPWLGSQRQAEPRRLLRLRTYLRDRTTAAVQGRRLRAHRHRTRTETLSRRIFGAIM